MSNDMKLIMESWRKAVVLSEGSKKDLFEDIEYIQEVLGIEVPLNENNEMVLSEELKQQIINEENFVTKWFKSAYEEVKTTSGQLKNLGTFLLKVATNKRAIAYYIPEVKKNLLIPMEEKLTSLKQSIIDVIRSSQGITMKAGILFNRGVEKLIGIVDKAKKMPKGWKSALLVTAVVVLGYYMFDWVKEKTGETLEKLFGIEALKNFLQKKAQNIIEFFAKDFMNAVTDLVSAAALETAKIWIEKLMFYLKIAIIAAKVLEKPIKAALDRIEGSERINSQIAGSTA